MNTHRLLPGVTSLLLAANLACADTPQIPTQQLTPTKPALKQDLQLKTLPEGQKQAIKPLVKAQIRPLHANHSARPPQSWCEKRDNTTIEGRVTLYYNLPGPPDGPQYQGVLEVTMAAVTLPISRSIRAQTKWP